MPDGQDTLEDRDFVQSLERGLAVIRAFGEGHSRLTLTEAANRAGISRAAARRLLLTLQKLGYVGSDDGKHFVLRPAVLDLGYAYLAALPWWREAQRLVAPVAVSIGHACAIGVLDGRDVVYVAYAAPHPVPGMDRSIGTRLPAHATAIGRVLLAGLAEEAAAQTLGPAPLRGFTPFTITDPARLAITLVGTREAGHCLIDQELRLGLRSLAVPVLDRAGQVRAALSASFGLTDPSDPMTLLPALRQAAANIGRGIS